MNYHPTEKKKLPVIAVLVNSLVRGGAERIALVSAGAFKRKGYEVLLICLEKEPGYTPPKDIPVLYLTDFHKLVHPGAKVPWLAISASRLARIVREQEIGLVQSHLIRSNLINVGARFFGARHHAQLVSHLPMHFQEDPIWSAFLKKSFFRWFYRQADEVISISQLMKEEIDQALHLEEEGINHRVVYNPHDLDQIHALAGEEADLFHFAPHKRYVISAGRLLRHKRVEVTVEAFQWVRERFPEAELLILGEGKDRPFFEQYARKRGLSGCVHFLGNLANPFPYIARSDVFVLSSELEGLPNILIESLACGTPVIAADCISGPREILHPASDFRSRQTEGLEYAPFGVLTPVGRPDLLAAAIERLFLDEALRRQYQEEGKAYVARFDKSRIVDAYLASWVEAEEEEPVHLV